MLEVEKQFWQGVYVRLAAEAMTNKKKHFRNEEVVCRGYGNTYKAPTETQIGRNELCPCGSGLKYKKCCMKTINKENQNGR